MAVDSAEPAPNYLVQESHPMNREVAEVSYEDGRSPGEMRDAARDACMEHCRELRFEACEECPLWPYVTDRSFDG